MDRNCWISLIGVKAYNEVRLSKLQTQRDLSSVSFLQKFVLTKPVPAKLVPAKAGSGEQESPNGCVLTDVLKTEMPAYAGMTDSDNSLSR
jgi:hypothetical protein